MRNEKRGAFVVAAFLAVLVVDLRVEAEVIRDAAGRPVLLLNGMSASVNLGQVLWPESA